MTVNWDELRIVDIDTHVIEPYDLWTSRMSVERWGDLVPHVKWDENAQEDTWYFGDQRICTAAGEAQAGFAKHAPDRPARLSDADPATWDAKTRLRLMDDYGIYAQILYPNVAGFGGGRYLSMAEPALALECVQAYNDYLAEWSSADSNRLIPIMALPLWDMDATFSEMSRCTDLGHKGIVMSSQPEGWGHPNITSRYWDPLWARAQEMGLPINFHIASGDIISEVAARVQTPANGRHANFAALTSPIFMGNMRAVTDIICAGICHRFPKLNFVSVESGVGWLPYALTLIDWMWQNCGVHQEHPEYELLPSEYFARQIYGSFWFETDTAKSALAALGPDNIFYETDFPHPTSMSPGKGSIAEVPIDYLRQNFTDLDHEVAKKIFQDNARRVYNLT